MAVETLVSVEEHLKKPHAPDVDYTDGVLVERNVADWLHWLIQRNISSAVSRKYPHVCAAPELWSLPTAIQHLSLVAQLLSFRAAIIQIPYQFV